MFLIDSDPRAVIIRRTRMEPPAAPEAAATALSPLRKNFHLLVVVLFFFPLLLLLYSCFSLFFSTQFLLDGDISATAAAAVAGAHLHAPPPRWPICKSSDWIVALPPKNRTTDLNEINTAHLHAHRRKRKKQQLRNGNNNKHYSHEKNTATAAASPSNGDGWTAGVSRRRRVFVSLCVRPCFAVGN